MMSEANKLNEQAVELLAAGTSEQIEAARLVVQAFTIQNMLEAYAEKQALSLLEALARALPEETTIWDAFDSLSQDDPAAKEAVMSCALDRLACL